MVRRHNPLQVLHEAKQIARDGGCFVTEKRETADRTVYLLYRVCSPKNVFIGKRSDPAALRALVCRATNFR